MSASPTLSCDGVSVGLLLSLLTLECIVQLTLDARVTSRAQGL